jgi:hypothetical protein
VQKEIIVIIGSGTGKEILYYSCIAKGFVVTWNFQVTLEAKKQGIEQLFPRKAIYSVNYFLKEEKTICDGTVIMTLFFLSTEIPDIFFICITSETVTLLF